MGRRYRFAKGKNRPISNQQNSLMNPEQKLRQLIIGDFTVKRFMYSIFQVVAIVFLCIFLYAYFFDEKIIFQPPPSSYMDSAQIIKLDSGDGAKISAIHLLNPDARYTILYSHGNAEDIGQKLSQFLGVALNVEAMTRQVDATLYRNRSR